MRETLQPQKNKKKKPPVFSLENTGGLARSRQAVSRVLFRRELPLDDSAHSSRDEVALVLEQRLGTTRTALSTLRKTVPALLQMGFAVPPSSPRARCALAAPFHPCSRLHEIALEEARAVCSLWHFPSSHLDRPLACILVLWSPDFPPASTMSCDRSLWPANASPAAASTRRRNRFARFRLQSMNVHSCLSARRRVNRWPGATRPVASSGCEHAQDRCVARRFSWFDEATTTNR